MNFILKYGKASIMTFLNNSVNTMGFIVNEEEIEEV